MVRRNWGSVKAVRSLGKRKWLVVVYGEVSRKDNILIRKDGRAIAGLTILNASARQGRMKPIDEVGSVR